MNDLPIIQKTYDLIKWYVPILNRLPRNHKFMLGDRMIAGLYDLLEGLIIARYAKEKLAQLESLNAKLDILRHQTRLLLDFELIKEQRYEYAGQLINDIGNELGSCENRYLLLSSLRESKEGTGSSGCCAVVRGTTIQGTAELRIATTTTRTTGTTTLVFG